METEPAAATRPADEAAISGLMSPASAARGFGYILLAFVLGTFYFTFLTTIIAVGVGTAIIWIGVGILAAGVLTWRELAALERRLTRVVLRTEIPDAPRSQIDGFLRRARDEIKDRRTWRELVYLWLIRFPLDTFNFAVAVAFVASSLGLVASPIVVQFVDIKLFTDDPWWLVDSTGEALVLVPVGLVLLWVSIIVTNLLSRASARTARAMLS